MMKRIISLILLAAIALFALTGCAYDYADDDMSEYAVFNGNAFAQKLLSGEIKITEGSFGHDEEKRWVLVADAIYEDLAKNATSDGEHIKEGKPGAYDVLYYVYYATDKDGHVFFTDKMKESGASKLQLGISTLEGLDEKIAAAAADKDVKDYLYSTDTTGETKKGDLVFVTYTLEYTDYKYDKDGNKVVEDGVEVTVTVTENVTTALMVLDPDREGLEPHEQAFINKLISTKDSVVKAGTALSSFSIDWKEGDSGFDVFSKDDDGNTVDTKGEFKYSKVKVEWIVKDGKLNELADGGIKHTPYDTKKETTDAYGDKVDLKDVELTYHVYPVYFVAVPELTAEVVLDEFYASLLSTKKGEDGEDEYVIKFIEDEKYKYEKDGETKTFVELITEYKSLKEELKKAEDEYEKAKEDYDTKKKAVDESKDPTDVQKDALALAQTNLNEAKTAKDDAQKKLDDVVAKIYGCTGGDVKADLVAGYKDYRYYVLENTYKNEIKNALAGEIYALAKKHIEYDVDDDGYWVLPRKAVREAYDRVENNLKYEFYEGTYSGSGDSAISNYKHYEVDGNGGYDAFVRKQLSLSADASKQDVEDAIGAQAENAVKEIVLVYSLRDFYGEAVEVTDDDIEEFKETSWQYWLLCYQVGEENVDVNDYIHAIQLDKILNHILEENTPEGELKISYPLVKYDFKEAEAEEDK